MDLLRQTKTFLKQNTLFNPNGASNKTDFCSIHLKTFYNLIFLSKHFKHDKDDTCSLSH